MSDFTIRDASPADASQLLTIYAYYIENTAITFEYDVPSLEEFQGRIAHTLEKYPYLVIQRDQEILGYAYAGPLKERAAYDRSCEMTVYIKQGATGGGLGRAIYEALESRLRDMGILNLYACIAYPRGEDPYLTMNSPDFHAHLGYETIGTFHQCGYKFHRWYDMIWMEKLIGEHK